MTNQSLWSSILTRTKALQALTRSRYDKGAIPVANLACVEEVLQEKDFTPLAFRNAWNAKCGSLAPDSNYQAVKLTRSTATAQHTCQCEDDIGKCSIALQRFQIRSPYRHLEARMLENIFRY